MKHKISTRISLTVFTFTLTLLASLAADAEVFINEIYFDPPGGADSSSEYIELRGTPGMSLNDHYLIFLENELSATANPGVIENIFDFGAIGTNGASLGSNGFLTIRQGFDPYTTLDPASSNFENTATLFTFGSAGMSSVGHSDINDDGVIENSGFTAMLVRNDGDAVTNAPMLGQDLDVGDDNELDVATGATNWTILDSVGLNSEISDINGLLYAPVNFSAGTPEGGINVPEGAESFDFGAEIEYIGRWGDSTGSTLADWHAANLTNDGASGFAGPDDFRISGEPHGVGAANQFATTSQGLPYGALVTGSLGKSNRFVLDGDYTYDSMTDSFDGSVDGRDFLLWQKNLGFGLGLEIVEGEGATATREHGDGNLDRTVDGLDLDVWEANYGDTLPLAASTAIGAIPEPASTLLLSIALSLLPALRLR